MRIASVLLVTTLLPLQLRSDVAARRALNLSELKLPPGFEISIYARNLGAPRMIAVSPNDILFVSDISQAGRIWAIPEAGRAVVFASGLRQPHGLAFRGNDLYVAETNRIIVFRNAANPSLNAGAPEVLAPLPTGGQHTTRTIVWDADGKLIATAGSTCNICNETDERRAAAMRFDPDNWRMEIFARGLRNSVGMALHPVTNEIWATDNGGDNLGDDQPPEEINILRFGKDYGWPRCFGDDGRYAPFTGDCSSTERPELKMQAHSAPLGIGFYLGDMFPLRYKNDAFVAFHG